VKISAKLRRDAADACAIMATLRANYDFTVNVSDTVLNGPAGRLAWKAFHTASPEVGTALAEYWAEAEAMLREGWTPEATA